MTASIYLRVLILTCAFPRLNQSLHFYSNDHTKDHPEVKSMYTSIISINRVVSNSNPNFDTPLCTTKPNPIIIIC